MAESIKSCSNCVYFDTRVYDPPCCSCVNFVNWEEQDDG